MFLLGLGYSALGWNMRPGFSYKGQFTWPCVGHQRGLRDYSLSIYIIHSYLIDYKNRLTEPELVVRVSPRASCTPVTKITYLKTDEWIFEHLYSRGIFGWSKALLFFLSLQSFYCIVLFFSVNGFDFNLCCFNHLSREFLFEALWTSLWGLHLEPSSQQKTLGHTCHPKGPCL